MRSLLRVLVFAALLFPGVAAAQIDCPTGNSSVAPIAIVQVNGVCFDLSGRILQEGKLFELDTTLEIANVASIALDVTFNPDPFISFGTTTTNLVDGPVTYAFLFGTPIVPGFYDTASSTGGVTVTTPGPTATVDNSAIYPTYISGYGTLGGVTVLNLGVDLGTDPCTAGAPGGTTLDSETCNQGNTSNTFPSTFLDDLEALLTYTQTTTGSVVSWSGAVSLDQSEQPVPEPATLTFLAVSSLALGAVRLARRRRHQGSSL